MGASATLRRIEQNFAVVSGKVAEAAQGRPVKLVCVTKYARPDWMEALLQAGATDLAENLLPDAGERFAALRSAGHTFTAHLIGAQQSRKLKLIPGNFDWFQAVDSLDPARKLQDLLAPGNLQINALLQVNIAEEPQKHGVLPAQVAEVVELILNDCPQLNLRGLMAIPPWPDAYPDMPQFERGTRHCFRQMKDLFDRISANQPDPCSIDTLSLGMSLDYVWAIAEGATMVRVGSALFEGLEG